MASVNMAIVVGFVGNDPRITTLQSGRKCASFALATTEAGYTTQSGQQIPEKTEWHNIVVWGKTAEVVSTREAPSMFRGRSATDPTMGMMGRSGMSPR